MALEHRHFVIGNRYSNDPLSIAMFQCTVIAILIFGVSSRNLRKIYIQNTKKARLFTRIDEKNKRPEAEKMPKSWQQQHVETSMFPCYPCSFGMTSSFPGFSQVQAFYLYLMKQRGPLQLLPLGPGGNLSGVIF